MVKKILRKQDNNTLFYKNVNKQFFIDQYTLLKKLLPRNIQCKAFGSGAQQLYYKKIFDTLPENLKNRIKFYYRSFKLHEPAHVYNTIKRIFNEDNAYQPKRLYDTTILRGGIPGHYIGGVLQKIDTNEYNLYFIGDLGGRMIQKMIQERYGDYFKYTIPNIKINLYGQRVFLQVIEPLGRCLEIGTYISFLMAIY